MANKKLEKEAKQVEQSIWSVRINSQLLYKKAVDGRTILLGMTAEENKKVAEVMEKAVDDLTRILEKRTTQHEAPAEKEQVTSVQSALQEVDDKKEEFVEQKGKKVVKKPVASPQSKVRRGPGGKFISKNAPKGAEVKSENTDSESSFLKKLMS